MHGYSHVYQHSFNSRQLRMCQSVVIRIQNSPQKDRPTFIFLKTTHE